MITFSSYQLDSGWVLSSETIQKLVESIYGLFEDNLLTCAEAEIVLEEAGKALKEVSYVGRL